MVRKILLITSGYPNTWKPSSGIFIKRQVDILEASGEYRFDVLSTRDSRKGIYSFAKYIRLVLRVLAYSLSHRDFDMIHAHEAFPAGLLALIPKILRKKKLLITLHGGPMHSLDTRNALFKGLIGLILRNADKLICVSRHLCDRVVGLFPIREEGKNMEVINMGVVLHQFRPFPKSEARTRLGLDFIALGEKIVMLVGRLVELKGGVYLIRAAKILKDKNMLGKISIVFVGAGPEEQKLKSEALRLGVCDDVFFVGAKSPEEIYLWMSAADVLTVPSLKEGFGLVALEAMACGTPVISTDSGGLKEFVKHGENGLIIKPQDARGIAEGVSKLLGDQLMYRKFVENGLATAQQNSAEKQAFRVGKIYRELILDGDK